MKPATSFCLTAASNRVTVSSTEYLLGLVITPSSAACAVAGPVHIANESAKLATSFLKLIGIPNMLVSSDRTQRPARGVKARRIPAERLKNFKGLYAAARPLGTMATRLYAAVVRFLQRAAALRPPSPLHDKFALSCRPRRCERRSP